MADVFTKQGSKREALEEIVLENKLRHTLTKDNLVMYEQDEFVVKNLVTKMTRREI